MCLLCPLVVVVTTVKGTALYQGNSFVLGTSATFPAVHVSMAQLRAMKLNGFLHYQPPDPEQVAGQNGTIDRVVR